MQQATHYQLQNPNCGCYDLPAVSVATKADACPRVWPFDLYCLKWSNVRHPRPDVTYNQLPVSLDDNAWITTIKNSLTGNRAEYNQKGIKYKANLQRNDPYIWIIHLFTDMPRGGVDLEKKWGEIQGPN